MPVLSLIHKLNDLEISTKARVRFGDYEAMPADLGTFFYFDSDQSYSGKIIDIRKGGNVAFQLDSSGNVTSGGTTSGGATFSFGADGVVQFSLSQTPNIHSGTRGIHLNKASSNGQPHGISYDLDGAPVWEMGIDATTTDFVFAYSHSLQADVWRMRADTGQIAIGPTVGQPSLSGPQFNLFGGSLAVPKPPLSLTQYSASDYSLQLLTGAASSKRTKIVFQAQITTGFQLGTDSTNNDSDDFFLFANASSTFPIKSDNAGNVTLGSLKTTSGGFSAAVGGNGTSFQWNRQTFVFAADSDETLDTAHRASVILDVQAGVISTTRTITVPGAAAGSFYIVINRNANPIILKIGANAGITVGATRSRLICFPGGTTAFSLGIDNNYTV